jgi:hypothetical protein
MRVAALRACQPFAFQPRGHEKATTVFDFLPLVQMSFLGNFTLTVELEKVKFS